MDLTSSINSAAIKADNDDETNDDVTQVNSDVTKEDSPENSPEMLPINSVDYHQVCIYFFFSKYCCFYLLFKIYFQTTRKNIFFLII